MNITRLINITYRIRRRIGREVRKRGRSLEFLIDRRNYRRATRLVPVTGRFSTWLSLAPWGAHTPSNGSSRKWCNEDESAATIVAAERACAHEFDLLGSGLVELGSRIDWHADFKSGYRWDPTLHHSKISWDNLPPGIDIKVPWELSRCLHFSTLGLADWISGDGRYYAEWKAQIHDWITANAVGRGVNWACAMDVGMRAVNWLNAALLFRERIENDHDPVFFAALSESLWHHGLHVQRNLEWSGPGGRSSGNHFLANLVGLLAIGAFFRSTVVGRGWWIFAKLMLEHEITRQVNPDGTSYETSTSYHRLVMEMFLWSDTLAEQCGEPFSPDFRQRLDRMADFATAYSQPGGNAVQFGDNDSGRLLCAGLDDGSDHRYLANGECGFGGRFNRLLLRGLLPMPGSPSSRQLSFPDGGFHFINKHPIWLGLRAGPVSHGGAHAHCDQLSLVLNLWGRDIFVDRGTGVYTPDSAKRNRYRSTALHNVCQINGWEQNGFSHGRHELFQMPEHTHARMTRMANNDHCFEWEAEHRGFERYREGLRCRRNVKLTGTSVEIEDKFDGLLTSDQLAWSFHLAPGLQSECDAAGMLVKAPTLLLRLDWDFESVFAFEQVPHSPAYGAEMTAMVLKLRATVTAHDALYRFRVTWSPQS